mgnify:CR=1 FL=1
MPPPAGVETLEITQPQAGPTGRAIDVAVLGATEVDLEFNANVEPAQVQQWFDDLLALASIAESLPAPQTTAQETSVERLAHSMRKPSATLWIAAAVVVGVVLCPTSIIAVATVIYLLAAQ